MQGDSLAQVRRESAEQQRAVIDSCSNVFVDIEKCEEASDPAHPRIGGEEDAGQDEVAVQLTSGVGGRPHQGEAKLKTTNKV